MIDDECRRMIERAFPEPAVRRALEGGVLSEFVAEWRAVPTGRDAVFGRGRVVDRALLRLVEVLGADVVTFASHEQARLAVYDVLWCEANLDREGRDP